MPLYDEWMVIHGPDSKRDGRALSALLGDRPEVSRYLRSDSVITADDGGERERGGRGRLRCAAQPQREARRFGAQGSVVGQKIYPGVP